MSMTTVRPATAASAPAMVTRALVVTEARRMLRNPVPWACLALTIWAMWTVTPEPGEWPGASYEGIIPAVAPFLFGISVAASLPFHRARHDVAPAAPVSEARRTLARLLAALPFVVVALAYAVLVAWRERDLGGLWIGMEPGRRPRPSTPRPSWRSWSPWRWWPSRSAPPWGGGCRGSWPWSPRSSCCGSS